MGEKSLEFERQCKLYFKVKHAITFNSWTSGLISAVGAIGTEPGDELIVILGPWLLVPRQFFTGMLFQFLQI